MGLECTPNPDCKYAPNCFADRHHVYGRPSSGIARRFSLLEENVVVICRVKHEQIHASDGVLPLPDINIMKEAINGKRTK